MPPPPPTGLSLDEALGPLGIEDVCQLIEGLIAREAALSRELGTARLDARAVRAYLARRLAESRGRRGSIRFGGVTYIAQVDRLGVERLTHHTKGSTTQ